MKISKILCGVAMVLWSVPVMAGPLDDSIVAGMRGADVVLLGEAHDNADHHSHQAAIVSALKPRAIVWEMLTPDQAALVTPALISHQAALEQVLDWAGSNWPSFDMYYPIFAAAPQAQMFGAHVPRASARAAFESDVVTAFGESSMQFGLTDPLPDDEQAAREDAQMAAHCDALPDVLLPKMVAIQRLRDATLARAVVQAYSITGGPVVVITGTGHARKDWGVPVYLAQAAPELLVYALGQSEDGQVAGEFDAVIDSPMAERDDPCAAFAVQE